MAYTQLHDIIKHVRTYHRKLEDSYEALAEETGDERLRLLLDSLEDYEDELKRVLTRYSNEEHAGLLETWIQYDPIDHLRAALDEADLRPDMSLEEIAEQSQKFDRAVVEFYRQVADQVSAPRVQELVEALLMLEESKQARHAQQLGELVNGGPLSGHEATPAPPERRG